MCRKVFHSIIDESGITGWKAGEGFLTLLSTLACCKLVHRDVSFLSTNLKESSREIQNKTHKYHNWKFAQIIPSVNLSTYM